MTEPKQTFMVRLHDGGWEGPIQVGTGIYIHAAAAVPALLGLGLPLDFEIWSTIPQIADKHFNFRVRRNEFGGIVVEQLLASR